MADNASRKISPEILHRWLGRLKDRDPALYAELSGRMTERATPAFESAVSGPGRESADPGTVFETIVREGRPALLIQKGLIFDNGALSDATSKTLVERLTTAAPKINPIIPLVGRIDVSNFAGGAVYLGTGWLIAPDVVVTNRHVAELVAHWDGGQYNFRPGLFGDPIGVSVDYLHEKDNLAQTSVKVESVLYIEQDTSKADIAFLKVDRRTDGATLDRIEIEETDLSVDDDVAVIGYPARAPEDIIPDQAWMDRIYGSTYDVKRIAPGKIEVPHKGWMTHDCTTLGGNSGAAVIGMASGKVAGLHFAGLYMIENYAVPASILRGYLRDRPWEARSCAPENSPESSTIPAKSVNTSSNLANAGNEQLKPDSNNFQLQSPQPVVLDGSVSLTIPLHLNISLGVPQLTKPPQATLSVSPATQDVETLNDAVNRLRRTNRLEGVLAVRPGYVTVGGQITDQECIVVAAHPDYVDNLSADYPSPFAGYPLVVRPATISEQFRLDTGIETESVGSISYNDAERTGKEYSFDEIDEQMTVTCHVGPEQGWIILSDFIGKTATSLTSSMYQFYMQYIADAIGKKLASGVSIRLVVAQETRDPQNGDVPAGQFDRSETFRQWRTQFPAHFDNVYVPIGRTGLIAKSYHIKVTVRDDSSVWLSSGNWTKSSQPQIGVADLANPKKVSSAGNREWHVTIDNATLASRFRHHIEADFRRSKELGGTLEAVADDIMVDVPFGSVEGVTLEAAATTLVEPLVITDKLRVKPLLTPDRQGAVFTDAVLDLINSAEDQIVFQNQYITLDEKTAGNLGRLVEALIAKAKQIRDVRVILRDESGDLVRNVEELKRRGFPNVNDKIRKLRNTHTKGIVVDGKRVLLGSQNWSSLGVSLNRDASMIFFDQRIAQYYLKVFEIDWNRATALGGVTSPGLAAPRPAKGTTPPPGFVRMSLAEYLER